MDIQRQSYGDQSKIRPTDITRPNREAIAESNPPLKPDPETPTEAAIRERRTPDRVDVSETGRKVSERLRQTDRVEQGGEAREGERTERVRDLKEAYLRGELNTDARVDQAASRMLESY